MRRNNPDDRRAEILEVAYSLAQAVGYHNITHQRVAVLCDVSRALVNVYYPIEQLKDMVVGLAVERENVAILARAFVDRHPLTRNLSNAVQSKIIKFLLSR